MMACWFEADRLLKFSITGFASDPLLAWSSIALSWASLILPAEALRYE